MDVSLIVNIVAVLVAIIAVGVSIWLFNKERKIEKGTSLEKENKELRDKIEELKKQIELRDSTSRVNGITYYSDGTPICPICTATNPAFPVPIVKNHSTGYWACTNNHLYKEDSESNPHEKLIAKIQKENKMKKFINY